MSDSDASAGTGTPAAAPPAAPPAQNTSGRGGRGRGRGRGGRGAASHPSGNGSGATHNGTEQHSRGLKDVPIFRTPAEKGGKAGYDRVISHMKSHIVTQMIHGSDVAPILSLKDVTLALPAELDAEDAKSALRTKMWNLEVEAYSFRHLQLAENKPIVFTMVWDQCSKSMRIQVKGTDGYDSAKDACDCIWLVTTIRAISLGFETSKARTLCLDDALEFLMNLRQDGLSVDDFSKAFTAAVLSYEHLGGTITHGTAFDSEVEAEVALALANKQDEDRARKKAIATVRDKVIGTAFIKRSGAKYLPLRKELANAYALGNNHYPTDLTAAIGVLNTYQAPSVSATPNPNRPRHHQFAQVSGENITPVTGPGRNGRLWDGTDCYHCQGSGHYSDQCPADPEGAAYAAGGGRGRGRQVSFDDLCLQRHEIGRHSSHALKVSFTQASRSSLINPNSVILDSASTVSVFRNRSLLTNIGESPDGDRLNVYTNGGSQESTLVGTLNGFGNVWYNPKSLANILSMAAVRKKFRITMDTDDDAALLVHLPTGAKLRFAEGPSGLYYCNVNNKSALFTTEHCFLSTVEQNKSNFRRREVKGADLARELSRKLLHPASTKMHTILSKNQLLNCPVTLADAKRADHIYGPSIPSLRGRTTRVRPTHKQAHIPVNIPQAMYAEYKDVTLNIDFFYVNGIAVLHTISNCLTFRSVDFPPSRSEAQIMHAYNRVKRVYGARGFNIVDLHGDNEFTKIQDAILPTHLTVPAAGEHVGPVERSVRTMKEQSRAGLHGTPFTRVPILMVKGLLKLATMLLNAFPNSAGISDTLSPRNIVQGLPNLDFTQLKYEFGQYGELSEDSTITNTQAGRTKGAIALYPKGEHGTWAFMSLTTGMEVHGRIFTPLPLTESLKGWRNLQKHKGSPSYTMADCYTNGGLVCPSMMKTPSSRTTMAQSITCPRKTKTSCPRTSMNQSYMTNWTPSMRTQTTTHPLKLKERRTTKKFPTPKERRTMTAMTMITTRAMITMMTMMKMMTMMTMMTVRTMTTHHR